MNEITSCKRHFIKFRCIKDFFVLIRETKSITISLFSVHLNGYLKEKQNFD